jgi:hypothetical protein
MVDHRGWPYAGDRKCAWCGEPATRAAHDGCTFCDSCAMPGDMYLTKRSEQPESKGGSDSNE